MGFGFSIFLIAVGAALKFAVSYREVAGVDLGVVGIILMLVGVLGLILSLVIWGPRRRPVESRRVVDDDTGRPRVVDESRSYDDGGMPPP